jgi:hypothetical protein
MAHHHPTNTMIRRLTRALNTPLPAAGDVQLIVQDGFPRLRDANGLIYRLRPEPGTPINAVAAVPASVTINPTGDDNDILLNAKVGGVLGNSYSVALVDPDDNDAELAVSSENGLLFTVSLATGEAGAITSTAAQVIAALTAFPAFAAIMTAANGEGSDGTGVVTAVAATSLAGGANAIAATPGALGDQLYDATNLYTLTATGWETIAFDA